MSTPTGTIATMFHGGYQSVLGGELTGCCHEHTHLKTKKVYENVHGHQQCTVSS